jgi:Flp pilus assembly protein TadD
MTAMYVLIGNLYAENGDLTAARRYFEGALKVDPNFALAASNLAWVFARQGDLNGALPLAEKAWRLMPALDSIADVLGWIQYQRGNYAIAEPLLRRCVQQAPSSPMYHQHLGMTLAAIGKTEAAREQLRTYLRLQPGGVDATEVRTILASLH